MGARMPNPQQSTVPESALVVIDLANDFVFAGGVIADAGGPEYQKRAQSILPVLGRLVAAARAAGVTVVYTTDAHQPGDSELAKWPPHAMQAFTDEAHRQGLEYFKAWYASDPARQLRTTDEVIAEWAAAAEGRPERRAGHQAARVGK